MTRPFGLHDMGLVWHLRNRGIALDMQRAALRQSRPLHDALQGLMLRRSSEATLTFVCSGQRGGTARFIQVLACPERQEWQVVHLSPWGDNGQDEAAAWAGPLAAICLLAGRCGVWRVRAGMPAGGAEEEAFRQAGFVAYAHEEVHRLLNPCGTPVRALRPVTPQDAWALLQLANQIVPPAVQQAEGLLCADAGAPLLARLGVVREQGYVLERGGDLVAYVGLSRANGGAWGRFWLRQDARRRAGDVLRQAVALAAQTPVLYCAVRDYQAGLRGPLAGLGFEPVGVQVWMVRHTARPLEYPRVRHLAAMERRVEPATTPLHPMKDIPLAACMAQAKEQWTYEYGRRTDCCAIRPN